MRVFKTFVVSVLILLVAAACSQGSLSEGQRAEVEAVVSSEARGVVGEVKALLNEHSGRVNERITQVDDRTEEALLEHLSSVRGLLEDAGDRLDEYNDSVEERLGGHFVQVGVRLDEHMEEVRGVTSQGLRDTNASLESALEAIGTSADVRDALCTSDYWLFSLWVLIWNLLVHLEGGDMTLEALRALEDGVDDYGEYYMNVCRITDDDTWEVK